LSSCATRLAVDYFWRRSVNDIEASQCNRKSRYGSRAGEIVAGAVAILIGLVFLANNFGIGFPIFGWHNWWALFILIGAAVPAIRAMGVIDAQVVHWMVSALMVATVAQMFLLEVSFSVWWPIFLVIGGLSMLIPGSRRMDRR
jgi:hypothetical protein